MGDDRDNTRRLKEYKTYKEELERKLEIEKDEQELRFITIRLRSVKRRISDVESEIKYG
jgi:predicted  nucleic acid-binding Zn-ribbon protein